MADREMVLWLLNRDTCAPLIAHELAEKVREEADRQGYNTMLAYRRVADFIDPEAEREP